MRTVGILFWILLVVQGVRADTLPENNSSLVWHIAPRVLPLPQCASPEIIDVLKKIKPPNPEARRHFEPKSKAEWESLIAYAKSRGEETTKAWAVKYHVKIEKKRVEGVDLYMLKPSHYDPALRNKLFVYLHGGAYLFGGGLSGLKEAILIAKRVGIEVVAPDYRMPPQYPYPAALEDVVKLYKKLLQAHSSRSIVLGGSSAGGGLALAVVHRLKAEGAALPGALYIGTPWSDLQKRGDSLYINEGIDRKIVTYDGFVSEAAKLYAGKVRMDHPELSPVYGSFAGFPPTMLVSGTRDLFLSMTVRVHRKLKEAGVVADLNIYEGLSHVEYFVVPDAPESREVYRELRAFLKQHLSSS